MPENSIHSYDLYYRKLRDSDISWYEVDQIVEYFVTHKAERRQVGDSAVAAALFDLALHEDGLIYEKAIWGLVQLERWEELGRLVCIWIDPGKELSHISLLHGGHYISACILDPNAMDPLGRGLEKNLQRPINTDPLWPAIQKFFRREDETLRRRTLYVIQQLHIAPAYLTLKHLIENPEQSALHADAIGALGGIGDDRAVRYLISLLGEPERQFDALYALQLAASPKAVPALRKLLETFPTARIQVECIDTLGKSGGDVAARILLKYVEGPYKQRVIVALGEAGSDVAVPRLKRFLCNRNSEDQERELAAEALSEINTPESLRVLAETLSGDNKKAASYAGTVLCSRRDS